MERMSIVWGSLVAVLIIVWVITIGDIIRRSLSGRQTVAWLLLVVLVPFLGAILYWALKKPTPDEVQRSADAQRDLREHSPYDPTRSHR
jgi:hypothetical protein